MNFPFINQSNAKSILSCFPTFIYTHAYILVKDHSLTHHFENFPCNIGDAHEFYFDPVLLNLRSIYSEIFMVSFILDLHSSTRSYSSRVDVDILPTKIQALPPPTASIKAAGPAKEYHSDSAESLTEIPVSSTRTGGNINASPGRLFNNNHASGMTHGGFSRNSLPSTKKVSTKKKKHSLSSGRKPLSPRDSQRLHNINNNYNSSMNGDVNGSGPPQDTLLSSTLGATDVSMGTRTLPETEILDGKPPLRRQRSHRDVPPLDLSELSGNSDNEITGTQTGGKKRKKSLVTKI